MKGNKHVKIVKPIRPKGSLKKRRKRKKDEEWEYMTKLYYSRGGGHG